MKRLNSVVAAFIWSFSFTPTLLAQTPATAPTESPVLTRGAGVAFALTEEQYRKEAAALANRAWFVAINRKPSALSANARFGYNFAFGGFNRGWVLDGDEKQGYTLYADLNGNGDLTDDAPLKLDNQNGIYTGLIKSTVTEKVGGREESYPVDIKVEVTRIPPPIGGEPQLALKIYTATLRRGVIRVGGREVAFALAGSQGIYNFPYSGLYFDLDGDGKLDMTTPESSEKYALSEKYINFGDVSYEFVVDRYGRNLTLKPLAKRLPSRAILQPGYLAPEFSFTDTEGKSHKLSDYRGKVVLLDFWGVWCGPCVAEAPKLAATYHQLREKGFEVIGVHLGDNLSEVKKFTAEQKMTWSQTLEKEDGALHTLFRVEGWPTYYLIGKDGKILANSLRPGEQLIKEIENQLKEK